METTKIKPIPFTGNGCYQCWNCERNTACNSTKHDDGKYYLHPECNGADITKAEIPCKNLVTAMG